MNAANTNLGGGSTAQPHSSSNYTMRGSLGTTTTLSKRENTNAQLTSSIINDRDAKLSQRDAQLLNPDSRLYKQVKY